MQSGIRRTRLIHWALIIVAGALSLFFAYQIRFEFQLPLKPINWSERMWDTMHWILPLEYILFFAFGLFNPLVARFRWRDFLRVVLAVGLLTGFLLYLWYIFSGETTAPRSVILINGLLLLLSLCFIEALSSQLRMILTGQLTELPVRAARVVVVGTGFLAYQLIEQSRVRKGLGIRVVGMVATRGRLRQGDHWLGVSVGGTIDQIEQVVRRFDPDKIIITDLGLSDAAIRHLLMKSRAKHVPLFIVPSAQELFNGVLRMETIRPVGLEDLLCRNTLDINLPRIHQLLSDQCVLVTGAGGSIGSELCRQILFMGPRKLLLLDSSEVALFQIEQELMARPFGERVEALLVNIRDRETLKGVFEREKPDIIFHSAALKHVPMLEAFPGEGLLTNALATHYLAELADAYGVERMVFISTDKAINPTSVMGASKRIAEQLLQSRSRESGHTHYVAVRFGNVISSSGSVIPIFERQISTGGPVTVTHTDVMRYFMSIPEAVGLVLQSATQGSGGEIFMLDMGQPLKVLEIARLMIQMRGLEPDEDIEIKIIGLRPGEKLFEELSYDAEVHATTSHPRVYKLSAPALSPDEATALLHHIEQTAQLTNPDAIRAAIKVQLPEFIGTEGKPISRPYEAISRS